MGNQHLLLLAYLLFCLPFLGCGKNNGGDSSQTPDLRFEEVELQIDQQVATTEGKNLTSFIVPLEKSRVFIKVRSLGETTGLYSKEVVYHNFGDNLPGGGAVTIGSGCQVVYERFNRTVLDQSKLEVDDEDLSFTLEGQKIIGRAVRESPLIYEFSLPETYSPHHNNADHRRLKIINNTFQVFVKGKRNLSDCYAKGFPGNQFDIIGLKEVDQRMTKVFGGKNLELVLLKELP